MEFRKISNVSRGMFGRYCEVRHPKGYTDNLSIPEGFAMDPVAVGDTKQNAVVLRVDNHVALVESRGSRLWVYPGGLWAQQRAYRYFRWEGPGPCPDICGYCGFDNGPNGESRYGWDCGGCGGN